MWPSTCSNNLPWSSADGDNEVWLVVIYFRVLDYLSQNLALDRIEDSLGSVLCQWRARSPIERRVTSQFSDQNEDRSCNSATNVSAFWPHTPAPAIKGDKDRANSSRGTAQA